VDDPSSLLLPIVGYVVIATCLLGLALLSMSEAALLGISRIRLRALLKNGDPRSAVLYELVRDREFLTAAIVGINICIITISTLMTVLVSHSTWHGQWREEALHIGMLLLMLIVAEIAPKTYGALNAESVALRAARPMSQLVRIVGPVMLIITRIADWNFRICGIPATGSREPVTRDEIRVAADVSEEEGALPPAEGEMLDNVLELSMARVSEIMVPRVDIVALDQDDSLERALEVVIDSGHSRIPICDETLDEITGILYVKDLLVQLNEGASQINLNDVARAPVYVPETKLLDELFSEMREHAVHIAIIVDEFGGTEGLVTIEDILEELVGEIEDEHDVEAEEIVFVSEDEIVVSSRERIEFINQQLLIDLPDDEFDTIGGLVTSLAGYMPDTGEIFAINGVELAIETADEQSIQRVRIIVKLRDGGED